MKIRTDDEVIVISGKDKGKTGKVIRVDRSSGKVFVEGLNMVKRHQRANPARANAPVGVIETRGRDPRLQRGDPRPEGQQADAHRHRRAPSRARACASPSAPGRNWTETWHD